jgi:hypothetical protein
LQLYRKRRSRRTCHADRTCRISPLLANAPGLLRRPPTKNVHAARAVMHGDSAPLAAPPSRRPYSNFIEPQRPSKCDSPKSCQDPTSVENLQNPHEQRRNPNRIVSRSIPPNSLQLNQPQKTRDPKLKTQNCKPKPAADNVDSTAQSRPTKGAAILLWRNFAHFFANVASKFFANRYPSHQRLPKFQNAPPISPLESQLCTQLVSYD